MRKIRAYDCSNSVERPPHRQESFGPKENDLMRGLKKYCSVFDYEFIDQPQDAAVIITNDVFPKDILVFDKPRVKRMDGVYWDNRVKDRNESLNKAAMEADWIIFISEYSKMSFKYLYNYFSHSTNSDFVIPNAVDDSVFFPLPKCPRGFITWIASATNWAREEKRFDDLMVFADEIMDKKDRLVLIGQCDKKLASSHYNVIPVGYFESEKDTNDILNSAHAFINLSYRDAAPKVVCQAVNCKLPVLYANSGGTPELVVSGVGIYDDNDLIFEDKVPRLMPENMKLAYNDFRQNYAVLSKKARDHRMSMGYMETLSCYFWVMGNAIMEFRCQKKS